MKIQKPEIHKRPSPNIWRTRRGHKVKAIVVHITDGALLGALEWLRNPVSQVSAHYVIGRDGTTYQLVDENHTAWHAGVIHKTNWQGIIPGKNPNLYTIGIEVEGKANDRFTKEQYSSLLGLTRDICKRHNLPFSEQTVINHRDIRANKTCPGIYNDAKFLTQLNLLLD